MADKKQTVKRLALVTMATLALSATLGLAMSIETEPVKVTHRNSGPRYDFSAPDSTNEVERTRIVSAQSGADDLPRRFRFDGAPPSQPEGEQQAANGEPSPFGHVAIRRIYLFPVMSSGSSDWSGEAARPESPSSSSGEREQQAPASSPQQQQHEAQMPGMFAKPFWPFLTPARPSPGSFQAQHERGPVVHAAHQPHLFGADEASRSPQSDQDSAASNAGEREALGQREPRPLFDPIQMMLDMMHQAISAQMVPPSESDLSNSNKNDNERAESASDERPKMPGQTDLMPRPSTGVAGGAKNETHEDIVEIEGKKYLRKTILNRHIGENIIFMTKRLIFVPLNETDETPATTTTAASTESMTPTTTTTTTTTSLRPTTGPTAEDSSVIPDRVGENKPTTTTTTTSSTTTDSPASTTEEVVTMSAKGPEPLSTSRSVEEPVTATTAATSAATEPSTESSTESMTTSTPKPSTETFVDRVSDVIEKAAERLVEETKEVIGSSTTTQAPVASDKQQ